MRRRIWTLLLLTSCSLSAGAQSYQVLGNVYSRTFKLAISAGTWKVNGGTITTGGGGSTTLDAKGTQAVNVFVLPARAKVLGMTLKTSTAFVGAKTLTVTIGDSVRGASYYVADGYNLLIAAANSNYLDQSLYKSGSMGESIVQAVFTADGPLSRLTAGSLDLSIVYTVLP